MTDESYGYGKDIGYKFETDGTVDFALSESGDISLVGGESTDSISQKRKNAIQQIILRIITPFGTLKDEEGKTIPFGSELPNMIGLKDTELNRHIMKAYVLSCLQDYNAIEAILDIDVSFPDDGVARINLKIKLKDDTEILFETITIGSV